LPHDLDRALALTAAWVMFSVCCVAPIVWMLAGSTGTESTAAIAGAFTAERQRLLLTQTLLVATGAAAAASGAGLPLGIALARCDPRRVQFARFAFTIPLLLPSYVLALAWVALAETQLVEWTYGMPAAIFVLAFSFYPIVMLATESAMRSVPSHLEEAGWLVDSHPRVWLKIVIPLIVPALTASAVLVFVLALSDFAVPSLLRVRVYTTEVFTAFAALYDFRLAATTALPLALIGGIAAVVALELVRKPFVGRSEHGPAGARWKLRKQQVTAAVLGVAAIGVVAVPIGAIASEARTGRALLTDVASLEAILNSASWSAAGATVVLVAGTLLGSWWTKARSSTARLAEALWIALFAVPATVAGVGMSGLWNRTGLVGDVYGSEAIVVVAYVSRFLPIAALLCAASLRRVAPAAEEAARVCGASWSRAFSRIVLPLSSRGLAAVWLIMFILMFGDVSLAILVAPPGESNLAVRAFTLMANSPVGDVAKIALVHVALSVLPLSAIMLLLRFQDQA
jgi:ABC-type Fe3+ transport system permease subunit